MKKLMLDLEALAVDSFDTGGEGTARGTVRGHDTRYTEFCNTRSCGLYTRCCQIADDDAAQPPAGHDEPFE